MLPAWLATSADLMMVATLAPFAKPVPAATCQVDVRQYGVTEESLNDSP